MWREPIDVQYRTGVHEALRETGVGIKKHKNNKKMPRAIVVSLRDITRMKQVHVKVKHLTRACYLILLLKASC